LKTSVTSVYHAQVDDALYHCRLGRKIQGHRWQWTLLVLHRSGNHIL